MKTPDNSLFLLIKSLNAGEKRYFKRFSSMHIMGEKNNYMRLFDVIEKQKVYDEAAVKKKLSGGKIISQFSSAKSYLYTMILKSTVNNNISDRAEIRRHMDYADFLKNKGLFKQTKKELEKAKIIANQNERLPYLIELFQNDIGLKQRSSYKWQSQKEIDVFFAEVFEEIKKLENEHLATMLTSKLFLPITESTFVRNAKEKKERRVIINHPFFKSEKNALTFNARYKYYNSLSSYYGSTLDFSKSLIYSKKLLQLEDDHFRPKESLFPIMTAIINNLLRLKKYNEIGHYLMRLRKIKTESEYFKNVIFLQSNVFEMDLYISTGDFKKGISLIDTILQNKLSSNLKPDIEVDFFYKSALINFGCNNFYLANHYLNKVLDSPYLKTDLQCFAKIMILILQFEMQHTELMEYTVKSLYRYLLKREKVYQVESILISFIRKKLPKMNSDKEQINGLKDLKNSIDKAMKDPFEQIWLEYFDLVSWLECKIKHRSFAEIVKEKQIQAM